MSHPAPWTCRSCAFILGHVRAGVLRPSAPVEQIDSQGVAQFRCPRCETPRPWFPSGAAAAAGGDRRPADRPG